MKNVVVTGACGALGTAVVNALASAGHHVIGIVQHEGGGQGDFSRIVCRDLADPAEADAVMNRAAGEAGGIDALVNVAGAFAWEPIESGALETWQRMFDVNVKTALCCCRAALRHMGAGGRIVNIGAASAEPAGMGMAPYAASKSAVARLTESLADELRARRIGVNAVLPQIIDTPANRRDMPDADPSLWTSPEAIADVILFLVSDQARAISGAKIPVSAPG